ncbi:hypothetical protein EB796_002523 [Bugula neritina]|uniref:Uncharacterized protein n=1 Tax=Bugula neritina TaxID=10212 RepID=A0A7J7KM05_BUGNE|nr:hypothetical protein EB796_002523 [Bugula neritina]
MIRRKTVLEVHILVDDGKQIYLQNETMFQATKLAFHREVDKIGLTYNHEKHFILSLQSSLVTLKCYESTYQRVVGACM